MDIPPSRGEDAVPIATSNASAASDPATEMTDAATTRAADGGR